MENPPTKDITSPIIISSGQEGSESEDITPAQRPRNTNASCQASPEKAHIATLTSTMIITTEFPPVPEGLRNNDFRIIYFKHLEGEKKTEAMTLASNLDYALKGYFHPNHKSLLGPFSLGTSNNNGNEPSEVKTNETPRDSIDNDTQNNNETPIDHVDNNGQN